MFVYVGSYTKGTAAAGIRVYELELSSGALKEHERIADAGDAFFLARHPQRPLLFAVDGADGAQNDGSGMVSAFAVDPATGHLTLLNRQATRGTIPCYVSFDPAGRYALVANYGSGSVAVFPIEDDGRLAAATDVVQHAGRGPHPQRQEGPHPHFVDLDPTGEHILVVEAIDPPHAQVIFAEGHDTVGAGTAHQVRIPSNWFRLRGQFVEGTLQVTGPGGGIFKYRRQQDGTLAVTLTWLGAVSRSSMTRAPE